MLLESLLIAIFAGIAGIDLFNGLFHIHRPIVTGAIVGLILGDLKMGLLLELPLSLYGWEQCQLEEHNHLTL